jgi:parallel beta-helix repeat protein
MKPPTDPARRLMGKSPRQGRRSRRPAWTLEALEAREVPAVFAFDFDTSSSPVAAGYTHVPLVAFTPSTGFGWLSVSGMQAVNRSTADPLTTDLHLGTDSTFLANVPNGQYDVVATLGDSASVRDNVSVWAEGQQLVSNLTTSAGQFLEARGRVSVSDGQMSLRLADGGGANTKFAIAGVTFTPVDPNASSLWGSAAPTAQPATNDPNAVELGMRFQPLVNGTITGVRFFKSAGDTGTHLGNLWTTSGQKLASATFTGESASGWQQVTFAQPVAVSAGTTYVASYYAPNGNYSNTLYYFQASGFSAGDLSALAAGPTGNGLYRYGTGGGFPNQTYLASNYWVDVLFQPGVSTASSAPTANAGPDQSSNEGSAVRFVGSATGSGLSYRWTFGDGGTATGTLTPAHVYTDNGTYTATLTVTDSTGQVATDTAVITVANVAPVASGVDDNNPIPEGKPVTIFFLGVSDPSIKDTVAGFRYSYDFNNDGIWDVTDSTSPSAQTTYNDNGTYFVRMRVKDKDGGFTTYVDQVDVTNVPPTASFGNSGPVVSGSTVTFTFSNQSDPSSVDTAAGFKYSYDFNNDGTWDVANSSSPTASYTFAAAGSYIVKGRITDKDGGFTDYFTTVTINAPTGGTTPPTANAGPDQASNEGSAVPFAGSATGTGLSYAWTFGDGGTTTGTLTPTHVYTDNGTYTATLTVTDSTGQVATDTAVITVANVAPTGTFGNNGPKPEGSAVTLSFTGVSDPSSVDTAAGFKYSYDFNNDGIWDITDSSSATAQYTFNDNGTYPVTGRVKDKDGGFTTYTTTVTVTNVAPTASFANSGPAVAGSAVTFTFSNQSDPSSVDTAAGFKYSYDFNNDGIWDITDSSQATAQSTFASAGSYTVKGRIKDKDGGFTDYSTTVTVTATATGATYYVSPTGSDTASGSATAPWQTIQHAADLVAAGDTVVVRAGSYAGFIMGWDIPTAGTATKPITFMADPAAAPGSVIINAHCPHVYNGIDLEPGCDYITIQGFTVQGAGGIATYPNRGYGIKVTGNNDQVLNNTITGLDYAVAGIHDDGGNNVVIQGNTISAVHNHGNSDLGHGIYVADADGVVVRGNTIHDNDYIGIHINGDPNLVTNALIAANVIYNNGQNGINCDGLQSSTVVNNLIYGYSNFGICLFQIDASGPSKNNVFANNTIVSTVSGAGAAVRVLNAGTGNTFVNNILLGAGGISYRISADSLPGLVSDYNVVGSLFQSEDTGATQTLAQWQSGGRDTHSLVATAAQLFVSASSNNYHLAPGSPAIDKGTSTDAPATDIEGNPRPHGLAVDIGAYEF